jgi:hypothetical protein
MHRAGRALTLLILFLGEALASADGRTSLVVKPMPGPRVHLDSGVVLRVQVKGPLPAEPLAWRVSIAGLDRGTGLIADNADGTPQRGLDIPIRITTEEVMHVISNANDDSMIPAGTLQLLPVVVNVFKATSGEQVAHGATTLVWEPRASSPTRKHERVGSVVSDRNPPS